MTWLEAWEGSYNGDWLGSQEPEPTGSMRAVIRCSSTVRASITTKAELTAAVVGMGWDTKQKQINLDDSQVIEIVLRCAVKVLNSDLHSYEPVL